MVSSSSSPSSATAEALAVTSKSQSMEEDEEILGPYQLPPRNNIARQYNRKDDNPMPDSPSLSEVLDADDRIEMNQEPRHNEEETKIMEEEEEEEDWDFEHEPVVEQRIYESPRLIAEDDEIFPPKDCHSILYYAYRQRWDTISEQAGPHRQDGSAFTIPRHTTPASLSKGIMWHYFATRVRSISLWLDHEEDVLPQWLDVLGTLFPNMEHLSLSQDVFEGEEEIEVSDRMRRLYILYRLPNLVSIDDIAVTHAERSLARPATPNGERVQRSDWMNDKSSLLDHDDEEDDEEDEHDGPVARDIYPNESIGSQTAQDLGAELARLTERIAVIHDDYQGMKNSSKGKSLDEDESLAGEQLVDLRATNSSHSGEQRQDLSSNSALGGNRDDREEQQQKILPSLAYSQQSRSLSTPAASQTSKRKSVPAPSRIIGRRRRDPPAGASNERTGQPTTAEIQHDLFSQPSTADTLDLVSVASSHHEWTAACGVLSFRSDRGCTPRLRLNFCGRGNRKRLASVKNNSKEDTLKKSTKDMLRTKLDEQGSVKNQTVPSQDLGSLGPEGVSSSSCSNDVDPFVRSPLRDKYSGPSQESSSPNRQLSTNSPSANQKVPPSKSLSSPFPMQFRDRTPSLRISTAETDLKTQAQHPTVVPSSPRARGSVAIDTITNPMTLTVFNPSTPPHKEMAAAPRKLMTTAKQSINSRSSAKLVTKGELPPPCPAASRRKVVAASLLQRGQRNSSERKQARGARRMERRKRAFQENARSTSVLDDLDDDDDHTKGDSSSNSEGDGSSDEELCVGVECQGIQHPSIHKHVSQW